MMMHPFTFRDLVLNRFFQDPSTDPNFSQTIMEFHNTNWSNEDKESYADDLITSARIRIVEMKTGYRDLADQNYSAEAIAKYAAYMHFLSKVMERIEEVAKMMVNI